MMKITLSPRFRDDTISVVKSGDTITINGDSVDLSVIPEGASLPADAIDNPWLAEHSVIERIEGNLHLTLTLPHNFTPEPSQAFPDPITVTADGPLDLPTNTWAETQTEAVPGGINVITTRHRWHQPDEVETIFIPDAPLNEAVAADAPVEV